MDTTICMYIPTVKTIILPFVLILPIVILKRSNVFLPQFTLIIFTLFLNIYFANINSTSQNDSALDKQIIFSCRLLMISYIISLQLISDLQNPGTNSRSHRIFTENYNNEKQPNNALLNNPTLIITFQPRSEFVQPSNSLMFSVNHIKFFNHFNVLE